MQAVYFPIKEIKISYIILINIYLKKKRNK
jgi:hypothetical protein